MVNLRLPGPTPVPADVVKAMSQPMIDHRGQEFHAIMKRLTANLQKAFETTNEVYVLTSSGTGAMEAAIVNVLSPGDRVLAVSVGNFGDRFSKIAKRYGASVVDLSSIFRKLGPRLSVLKRQATSSLLKLEALPAYPYFLSAGFTYSCWRTFFRSGRTMVTENTSCDYRIAQIRTCDKKRNGRHEGIQARRVLRSDKCVGLSSILPGTA